MAPPCLPPVGRVWEIAASVWEPDQRAEGEAAPGSGWVCRGAVPASPTTSLSSGESMLVFITSCRSFLVVLKLNGISTSSFYLEQDGLLIRWKGQLCWIPAGPGLRPRTELPGLQAGRGREDPMDCPPSVRPPWLPSAGVTVPSEVWAGSSAQVLEVGCVTHSHT